MKGKGYLIFAIVVLGLFGSYFGIKSLTRKRATADKAEWIKNERQLIIKGCKENSGDYTAQYPEIIDWYCSCMADTLLNHFSRAELMEQNKMSPAERSKFLEPLLKELSDETFSRIRRQETH